MRNTILMATFLLGFAAVPAAAKDISESACGKVARQLRTDGTKIAELRLVATDYLNGITGFTSQDGGKPYFISKKDRRVTAGIIMATLSGQTWLVTKPMTGSPHKASRSIYSVIAPGYCTVVAANDDEIANSQEEFTATSFDPPVHIGKSVCRNVAFETVELGGYVMAVYANNYDPSGKRIFYTTEDLPHPIPLEYKTGEDFVEAVGYAVRGSWLLIMPKDNPLTGKPDLNTAVSSLDTLDYLLVSTSEDNKSCQVIHRAELIAGELPFSVRKHFTRE